MGKTKGKNQVVVYLSEDVRRRLRVQAAREGRSMSALVEQALRSRLGADRRPLPGPADGVATPDVQEALARFGAPLWSSGRPTGLTLEQAIARGLEQARDHAALLRVLPVVLYRNRHQLAWDKLRAEVGEQGLPALGLLLDLTAEVTGETTFRTWADGLRHQVRHAEPVPFFRRRERSKRYSELARGRTPELVRRWGFLMATPLEDFRDAVERFCQEPPRSVASS